MRRELARQISGIFVPTVTGEAQFEAALQRVSDFQSQHGRLPVAAADTNEEAGLGRWLDIQRTALGYGDLPDGRVAQLVEALGQHWAPPDGQEEASPTRRARARRRRG
ncbi:MAG: hypothetical protein HOQ07_03985 [Sinomonas sp.]|nr:hypothetical protein [Sinomonas sp.]